MNIKSLLLGSAAALVAATGARAADAVVVAEPEAVEYVRVCDAYGAGFFYIPGTETCLKINGHVRVDISGGDLWGRDTDLVRDKDKKIIAGDEDVESCTNKTRATVRFNARTETELGTLRSYIKTRFDFDDGTRGAGGIPHAYIELGGFRISTTDSAYGSFIGAGYVINDDIIDYDGDQSNQVNYTFTGGNGFSAVIGLEQGDKKHLIDDYRPHVVGGVKFKQAWGSIAGVVGYDSLAEEFAGKLRAEVKFSDVISAFVMGGYQSDADKGTYYGSWTGDWAVWGGVSAKVSEKATINAALAYDEAEILAASVNVDYALVSGFNITPEIDYKKVDGADDAFGGYLRFQRNF